MRLGALVKSGILSKTRFADLLRIDCESDYVPSLIEINLNPNSKVFKLSSVFGENFSKSARMSESRMLVHQLMLNEVRLDMEKRIPNSTIRTDLETSQKLQSVGNKTPLLPDLVLENGSLKLAIELERSTKSRSEYISRMSHYSRSQYTHVLFFYSRDKQLDTFIQIVGPYRKIGFVNYFDRDHVFSKYFGTISFTEFLKMSFNSNQSYGLS